MTAAASLDVTPADVLCCYLIRLARLRGVQPEPFVVACLHKVDPDALMLDDLTPAQTARALALAKAGIEGERRKMALYRPEEG